MKKKIELSKESLLKFIKDRYPGGVSTGNLRNTFEGAEGMSCLAFEQLNVSFLNGLSEELLMMIDELMDSEQVHLHTTSLVVHLVDGSPIPTDDKLSGSNPPPGGYKKRRWAPMLLYPGKRCYLKECSFVRQDKRKKKKEK